MKSTCPACGEPLDLKLKLGVRASLAKDNTKVSGTVATRCEPSTLLVEDMSEVKWAELRTTVTLWKYKAYQALGGHKGTNSDDGIYSSPGFRCPNRECDIVLQMRMDIQLLEVMPQATMREKNLTQGLSEEQKAAVREAKQDGSFILFCDAVKQQFGGQRSFPKNLEAFYANWLKGVRDPKRCNHTTAFKAKPPQAFQQAFAERHSGSNVEYCYNNAIFAVVVDGQFKHFVPKSLAYPEPNEKPQANQDGYPSCRSLAATEGTLFEAERRANSVGTSQRNRGGKTSDPLFREQPNKYKR